MSETSSRKEEHVNLCVEDDVIFHSKTNGFDEWEFEHNALPELDFEEIDPSTTFLDKKISFPLMITGMTGGYEGATTINAELAEVCEELNIPMGIGSQRQALEDDAYHESYSISRKKAPHIPLIANIGAAEVVDLKDVSPVQKIIDLIEANALAIHLNPLQEFLQHDGNARFRGVLKNIEMLVNQLHVPIIIKEVGAGISANVALRIIDAGVQWIDVAGAGGTSWAGVEIKRRGSALPVSPSFWNWGIRTADALIQLSRINPAQVHLIASGGITDGVMIAKSIALGADLSGSARLLLQTLIKKSQDDLKNILAGWKNDLCGVMFLTGSRTITELKKVSLLHIHKENY